MVARCSATLTAKAVTEQQQQQHIKNCDNGNDNANDNKNNKDNWNEERKRKVIINYPIV